MGNKFPQTYLSYREEPSNHQHCQHTMFFHVLVLQQLSSLLLSPGPVPSKRIKKKKDYGYFFDLTILSLPLFITSCTILSKKSIKVKPTHLKFNQNQFLPEVY